MGEILMRRKNRVLFILVIILFILIFLVIPLVVSVSYGNIPFLNKNRLFSSDVLVSNNQQMLKNNNMQIFIKTYTWSEIKRYIIRKQMTFSHVFRDTVVIVLTAVIAVFIDRIFGRGLPKYLRRK